MKTDFSATIDKRGRWYIGYTPDVPGTNSQGRTVKEVSGNLKEALTLVLEANRAADKPTRVYKRTIVVLQLRFGQAE